MDTGANRVIVNDLKLLHNAIMTRGDIKDIGGSPTLSRAIRTHIPLHLKLDTDSIDIFHNILTVYL